MQVGKFCRKDISDSNPEELFPVRLKSHLQRKEQTRQVFQILANYHIALIYCGSLEFISWLYIDFETGEVVYLQKHYIFLVIIIFNTTALNVFHQNFSEYQNHIINSGKHFL